MNLNVTIDWKFVVALGTAAVGIPLKWKEGNIVHHILS